MSVPNPKHKQILCELVKLLNKRLFGKVPSNGIHKFLSHMLICSQNGGNIPDDKNDEIKEVEYMNKHVKTGEFCDLIEKKRIVDLHCLIENGYGKDFLTTSEGAILDMVFAMMNVPEIREILELCSVDKLFPKYEELKAGIVYQIYECLNATQYIWSQSEYIENESAEKRKNECMIQRGKYIKKLIRKLTDKIGTPKTFQDFIDNIIDDDFETIKLCPGGINPFDEDYDKRIKQFYSDTKTNAMKAYKKFTGK